MLRQRITGWPNCPSKFARSSPRKHPENAQRPACRMPRFSSRDRQLGSRASLCSTRKKNSAWTCVNISFSFSLTVDRYLRPTERHLTDVIKRMSNPVDRNDVLLYRIRFDISKLVVCYYNSSPVACV